MFISSSSLFATIKKMRTLLHLEKNFVASGIKSKYIEQLENESQLNPYCAFLKDIDALIRLKKIGIVTHDIANRHQSDMKILAYWDPTLSVITIPADPSTLETFYPKPDDSIAAFIGVIAHEFAHACDWFVGGFFHVTYNKKSALHITGNSKFDIALSGEYSSPLMNKMKTAIIEDYVNFLAIATDKSDALYPYASWYKDILEDLSVAYPVNQLIPEFKSYFIEMSTDGKLGHEIMGKLFPHFSNWYLNEYEPTFKSMLDKLDNDHQVAKIPKI